MCTRIIEETWTVLELATTVTEAQPAASNSNSYKSIDDHPKGIPTSEE